MWSGLDPVTGEQLGRFTNREIGGFDLSLRAPKSVSLLFAFGVPEVSSEVRDAHDAAVAAAFGYLEANAAGTRTGRGGQQMEPVDGFVAAMFRHRTSRAGDPHLHTHVLVANLAAAADGRGGPSMAGSSTTTPRPPATSTKPTCATSSPADSASSGGPSRTAPPTWPASTGT